MSATLGTEQTDLEKGLIRRGGGWYSTRQITPKDLVEHYGYGAKVVALGTQNHKEAKRLHLQQRIAFLEEFDQVRRALAAGTAAPEPEETPVTQISPTVVSLVNLDRLRDERNAAAKAGGDALAGFMREQREALRMTQAMLDGEVSATKDFQELEGLRNGLRAFLTGEGALAISAARAARAEIAAKPTGRAIPLPEVVARWAAERKPIPRTVRRAENIIDRFEAVVGKLPVNQVTRQHVLDFKDKMLAMGQTPANTNILLTILGVVLNYAVSNNLIPTNPASGIRVQDKRLAKSKRVFFDEAALASIFGSAIYSEGVRPKGAGGEAAYWLPLLALYTGARLEELGQLHPDDVRQESY